MYEGKPKIDLGQSVQLAAMPGDVIIVPTISSRIRPR
jgi:hypothetical protein